jgi:hypothetical protein
VLALAFAVGLLPVTVLRPGSRWTRPLLVALGAIAAVALLVSVIDAGARRWRERGDYRLYRASLLRSLVPVYALTLILVSVTARPYLRFEERRWMARDTLMKVPPGGGFTSLETRLTKRLHAEMTRAAAQLQPQGGPGFTP